MQSCCSDIPQVTNGGYWRSTASGISTCEVELEVTVGPEGLISRTIQDEFWLKRPQSQKVMQHVADLYWWYTTDFCR